VWLNNPRRPLEALWHLRGKRWGFSGGIEFVGAGWGGGPEGYNGRNGWAIGQEIEGLDPAAQDDLGRQLPSTTCWSMKVIPMFYDRG
jgi:starch phosphorylase